MKTLLEEMKLARASTREHGLRDVFRRFGWKLVAGLVVYYAVVDASSLL